MADLIGSPALRVNDWILIRKSDRHRITVVKKNFVILPDDEWKEVEAELTKIYMLLKPFVEGGNGQSKIIT